MESSTKKTLWIGGGIVVLTVGALYLHAQETANANAAAEAAAANGDNTSADDTAALLAALEGSSGTAATDNTVSAIPDASQDTSFQQLLDSIVNPTNPAQTISSGTPTDGGFTVTTPYEIGPFVVPTSGTVPISPAANSITANPNSSYSVYVSPSESINVPSPMQEPISVRNGTIYGGAQS